MYFLSEDERRYVLRRLLPEARKIQVDPTFRGWQWADIDAPLRPTYQAPLGVWEVAGGYCDTARDLFVRRVLGQRVRPNRQMDEGAALHACAAEWVTAAKRLMYSTPLADLMASLPALAEGYAVGTLPGSPAGGSCGRRAGAVRRESEAAARQDSLHGPASSPSRRRPPSRASEAAAGRGMVNGLELDDRAGHGQHGAADAGAGFEQLPRLELDERAGPGQQGAAGAGGGFEQLPRLELDDRAGQGQHGAAGAGGGIEQLPRLELDDRADHGQHGLLDGQRPEVGAPVGLEARAGASLAAVSSELRRKMDVLRRFETNRLIASVQDILARQPAIGADALAAQALPVIVEQRVDGRFLGLSPHLAVDALALHGPMVIDLKFGIRQPFHRLTTTGYALALESVYESPIDLGCLVYVQFRNDTLVIERDFHFIDDELRSRFIDERDRKQRLVEEAFDPGLPAECYPRCPHLAFCGTAGRRQSASMRPQMATRRSIVANLPPAAALPPLEDDYVPPTIGPRQAI